MRIVEPPSLDSPGRGRHGDDLDRLLSDFFRSELPKPWPRGPVADDQPAGGVWERSPGLAVSARHPSQRRSSLRSRFALAASITLLLAGSWFLSGKFDTLPGPGDFNYSGPEADGKFDHPGRPLREGDVQPRTRERIILDKNGQTGFRVDLDLP